MIRTKAFRYGKYRTGPGNYMLPDMTARAESYAKTGVIHSGIRNGFPFAVKTCIFFRTDGTWRLLLFPQKTGTAAPSKTQGTGYRSP